MGLFGEKTRKARAALRAALLELRRIEETHECQDECEVYRAANARVIRAEQRLPWYKRLDIEMTA